jgi:hypothetical protein
LLLLLQELSNLLLQLLLDQSIILLLLPQDLSNLLVVAADGDLSILVDVVAA